MSEIRARHSSYIITDVDEVPYGIHDDLSYYDKLYHKDIVIGYMYDEDKRELRIPRGYNEVKLRNQFKDSIYKIDKDAYEYSDNDMKLLQAPRDHIQEEILTYMIGRPPYEKLSRFSQLYIDLPPGEGKTYCGIAVTSFFHCNTVIFTPSTNTEIIDQWFKSAVNFTSCKDDDVLIVRGSKLCEDIISGNYTDKKVFIIPRSTVLSFVRKYDDNWDMLDALVKAMNVGIKIVDEAHMDFSTLVKIDCFTNVKRNYYMSASPNRSSVFEKKIYKKIFETIPKHGKELKGKEQNHIIMLKVEFESKPSYEDLKKIRTIVGPSQQRYGDYLLSTAREEFMDAYLFTVNYLMKNFRVNGGKMIVPCIGLDFIADIEKVTREMFPGYTTGIYTGEKKKKEKKEALEADIVFHTIKGLGTGTDIPNLQFIVNTVTFSSEVIADQLSGRLRRLKEANTVYVDIVNVAHKVAKEHFKHRSKILEQKAKNSRINILQPDDSDIIRLNEDIDNGITRTKLNYLVNKSGYVLIPKRKSL